MHFDRRVFLASSAAFGFSALWAKASDISFRSFSIGVIADVQYADKPDDPPHHYRAATARLHEALQEMNRHKLGFVVHTGDFIDGGWENYATIKRVAAENRHPWHFVLGNHDFKIEEDKKRTLYRELGMPARYYDFFYQGWHFVVLDGTDQSPYGWPAGSTEATEAEALLKTRYPAGKPWNGAIGPVQQKWLDGILTKADQDGTPVALICHFPIYPHKDDMILLWNADEIVSLIEPHPSVKLWLNGHEHTGGYGEKAGIHYLNLKGMLDSDQNAFAIMDFSPKKIVVHGYGREENRVLRLR